MTGLLKSQRNPNTQGLMFNVALQILNAMLVSRYTDCLVLSKFADANGHVFVILF